MNDRGREVLVKAALDGVPQAFEAFVDGRARCAVGVFGSVLGCEIYRYAERMVDMEQMFGLNPSRVACPECGVISPSEISLVFHLNDDHRYDFLKIARTL